MRPEQARDRSLLFSFFLSLRVETSKKKMSTLCSLDSSLYRSLFLATMLSTKGKPAPLSPSSSPLLSSKLKKASLGDEPSTVSTGGIGEERQEMKSFWEEHSKTATVEEMMLDSKASEIDLQERPEVSWQLQRKFGSD